MFDDGARIYVQFSDMKHVPAIFTETSSGRVLMSWELQFPYAVVTRSAQTLIFQLGPFEARAQRGGGATTAQASAATTRPGAAPATKQPAKAPTARTASTDALWYLNTPGTSGSASTGSSANNPAVSTASKHTRDVADRRHVEHAAGRRAASPGCGHAGFARERRRALVHLEVAQRAGALRPRCARAVRHPRRTQITFPSRTPRSRRSAR